MIDFDVQVGPISTEGEFFKAMKIIFSDEEKTLIFSKLSNNKFAVHTSPMALKIPMATADSIEKAVSRFARQFLPA